MGGSLSASLELTARKSAMATIVPSTRRGNTSAPKPRVMPSGIFSNQNVAANRATAIVMTAAAATRWEFTRLLQQAERFQRLLAFAHEHVELRLPGAGAGHAVHRLAG